MIKNESSTPYLTAAGMTLGLAVLIYGVEHHMMGLQAAGGAVIVVGILALAMYIMKLPEAEHSH